MTYSIVGRDAKTGELGVAVQSRAFGVGICAWARPGVGAVATQSFTEKSYGPKSLDLMANGVAPADALAELLAADERQDLRQVAFVDGTGRTAAHTGSSCIPDCGHTARAGVSAQGNMLASPRVWDAAADAFESGSGTLAERLLDALDAAEAAGGDFRGREAAALLVVSGDREQEPWATMFDLRVDNHSDPLGELRRLHTIAATYRRLRDFDEHTNAEEEAELARAAGLPDDHVALVAAVAAAKRGDLDAAVAALRPFAERDPRWRVAFQRYTRVGALPPELLERLDAGF